LTLLGIHHVQVTVPRGELERAREFYLGFLGLAEVEKPPALRARGGFWAQVGAHQLHVNEEDERMASRRAHVAYLVDDLEAWRARVAAAGFPVKNGEDIPGHRRFELRDPFGNRVEFLQRV
jgi:catechol 2,3-dioxygenase-like lactoylglutathione lyase family enzyme